MVGPGAAALVVGGGGYANVFGLSIALFVITYACLFYAARHRVGGTEEKTGEIG